MVELVSANSAVTVTAPASTPASDGSTAPTPAAPQPGGDKQARAQDGSKADNNFDNKALDKIAQRLVTPDSRLAISEDNFIRRFIYKFVDKTNGDVIRQYPHPRVVESLHAIEEMRERFVDTEA